MQKTSNELEIREKNFAAKYRNLQLAVTRFSREPQPPCCFCTDKQIWTCSRTGRECTTFAKYYSNYEL